jgi:hypothetical protein
VGDRNKVLERQKAWLHTQGMKLPELPLPEEIETFIDRLVNLLQAEKEENEMHQELLRSSQGFMERLHTQITHTQSENRLLKEKIEALEMQLDFHRKHGVAKPPKSIDQLIRDEQDEMKP